MTARKKKSPPKRAGGALVLVVLAIVFFTVLGLMVIYWPTAEPKSGPSGEKSLYVVPLELKLLTEATSKGTVVSRVRRGKVVTVLEEKGPWARVRDASGQEGWVERNALEDRAERERRIQRSEAIRALPPLDGVVERAAALFTGPGVFYPEMGSISRGEKVKVHARDHEFYAIDLGGEISWIEADNVDLSEAAGARFEVAANDQQTEPEPMEQAPQPPVTDTAPEVIPVTPSGVAPVAPTTTPQTEGSVYATVPPGGTQPQLIHRVTPRYPLPARRAGIEGPVIIRAIVRRDGTVDSAQILRDLPFGLGDAAREAVEQWQFLPATVNGRPIDVYYTVTVNYTLRGR